MSHASAVESLLFAALAKPTAAERAAFLDSACAGDTELRRQVEKLLQAEARVGDFLQKPVVELLAATPQPPQEPNRTTDHGPGGPASTDESHPAGDAAVGGLPAVPGYQVLHEIARGGMGRVLAAYDHTLDRDVALKVLLPGANADRFVRESKITARLPHPGIPPVHALGTLADGSPFLAMKLIAGRTLAVEMKNADRPRLLQAFTQVCQAVGFAHSRGIIHRDLKPANVMVGTFGEVQVMDWGLAKDLTSPDNLGEPRSSAAPAVPIADTDPAQTTDHRASGESTDDQTQAGTILGTPSYMAPEQARGEASDARADVFALGGMLCAILTGQPPFTGKSMLEVIQRARAADLAEATARLDGCGADAELVALCRGCLSPDPADRPADGQAVADALTAYLNGVQERLQAAQRARAVAVAREAEQAKRRKVQLALAAALVGLLLGGGAFAFWRNEQAQVGRERDVRNVGAVTALLDQCETALRAGDANKAEIALDAARERSAEGGAEQQAERLGQREVDLALLRDLDKVDTFAWTSSENKFSENKFPDPPAVATRTGNALRRFFGADMGVALVDDMTARVLASTVKDRLVTALDRQLRDAKEAKVRAVLRRADADPYRDAVRDAYLADDAKTIAELAGQEAALKQPPGFAAFLGESVAISVERRRELLQAAVARRPAELGLLMTMALTYPNEEKGAATEHLRWFQAAVAAAPDNVAAHYGLGTSLLHKGDLKGAVASLQRAIDLDPNYAQFHNNLGLALKEQGRVDEAIACFRQAIKLDPKKVTAHNNLGAIFRTVKRDYEQSIAFYRKAVEFDPKNPICHLGLGHALSLSGQVDEAIPCYQDAIALDPKNVEYHTRLGIVLCEAKKDYDGAIACFKAAIALDPKNATVHNNLGTALKGKGKVEEAIACWRQAIALDPKNFNAHVNLGNALAGKGQAEEAIACWRTAIELNPKDAKTHSNLGLALLRKDQVDEAIAFCRKAIAIDPNRADAHTHLGVALAIKGQMDEAIDCLKKAIALTPKDASVHTALGNVLFGKRQADEAIVSYRQAIALDPKYALAHAALGDALRARGQMDAAITSYREAIKLDPKLVGAHYSLGAIFWDHKSDYDAAIACFRQAIKLDPKLVWAHYSLGAIYCDHKRDYDAAIACFRQAIKLDPKLAIAYFCLGIAQSRKGQVDEVIVSCRQAVALDPNLAHGHRLLSEALLNRGRYAEAREATARAFELLPTKDPHHARMSQQLRTCERLAKLEGRFLRLLKGEEKAASAQASLDFSVICHHKRMNAAAARFFADAYAADPRLGDDLQFGRYYAAYSAALAAAGKGEDAAKLDDMERARLRKQALDWLRADLALHTKQLASHRPADRARSQQTLVHWQKDPDLAGLRDKDALAKLPGEERTACERLWADVAALLKKTETPAPKEDRR